MKTIRIEDYLSPEEPHSYIACDAADEDRLREAAVYCCFTAIEMAGEQFLSPRDIHDILVNQYGFSVAARIEGASELDLSMEYKAYTVAGRPTVALPRVRDKHAQAHPGVKVDIERRFSRLVGRA